MLHVNVPLPLLINLLLFLALHAPARADVIWLRESGQMLDSHMFLLEDPSRKLTLQDVLEPAQQARFYPANGASSTGLSRSHWWARLDLQRDAASPAKWQLEIDAISQYDLRLYWQDYEGQWQERSSGQVVPYSQGTDHTHRRPVFDLPDLPSNQPFRIYIRAYGEGGNSFPLRAWTGAGLEQTIARDNLVLGMLYGAIGALLLYNLFLAFSLRQRLYAWYSITVATALLFILSITGHGFQYLWPHQAVPFWLDRVSMPTIWSCTAIMFTQVLLETRQHLPRIDRLFRLLTVAYVAIVLLDASGERYWAAVLFALAPLVSVPLATTAAVLRWRGGYAPAKLYLLGFGAVVLAMVYLLLRGLALVHSSHWGIYVMPLAVTFESVLFSLALASRIKLLQQDKALAQRQAEQEKNARLEQYQKHNETLESTVHQRTNELVQANAELREREQRLHHAAFHDPLTDLPNRRQLMEYSERALQSASQYGTQVALVLIDLDHFKPVNDTHGHHIGDELLRAVAQLLAANVRQDDIAARLGGDEFAIVLTGEPAADNAQRICQRLKESCRTPMDLKGHVIKPSFSIGVAVYPDHASDLEHLYKAADAALYDVKASGRGNYQLAGNR